MKDRGTEHRGIRRRSWCPLDPDGPIPTLLRLIAVLPMSIENFAMQPSPGRPTLVHRNSEPLCKHDPGPANVIARICVRFRGKALDRVST